MAKDSYNVMDLKALRCFWATAKHGSLTQAGIELGISEAAISQRIKALESYLGTSLHESRGGRFRLTTAGERSMEMAMRLFDGLDEFERTISDKGVAATITLTTQDPVLRYLLPDIVQKFSRKYPLAHLRLLARKTNETVELVRINEVDIGVIPDQVLPEGIGFHQIASYPAYLLLPRGHPLMLDGRPDIRSLMNEAILNQYPLIVPEIDDDHSPWAEGMRRHGLPFRVGLEVGTIETVKHYVMRGQGIAIVSGICLTEMDGNVLEVIEIPPEIQEPTPYGVILRHDKHITASLNGLLSILGVAVCESAPQTDPLQH
jgi:DNA-binding transcriptional LysR family regulator